MEQPDLTAYDVLVALARALEGHVPLSTSPSHRIQKFLIMLETSLTIEGNTTRWDFYDDFVKHLGGDVKWHRWYQSARDVAEQSVGEITHHGLVAAYSCADPRAGAYSHLHGLITDVICAHGPEVVDD